MPDKPADQKAEEARPLRVIVCGTRDGMADRDLVMRLSQLPGGSTIIEGGARGVDRQAAGAATMDLAYKQFTHERHPADWEKHGRAAGSIRNQQMLDSGCDLVIAYPGPRSKGTWDMIRRAERAGVPVEIHHVE